MKLDLRNRLQPVSTIIRARVNGWQPGGTPMTLFSQSVARRVRDFIWRRIPR